MDLFSMDKKLADFSDQDFGQFLDDDLLTPSPSNDSNSMDFSLDNGMDQDWLDTFFDDPVLNDRMISDALQPHPQVQSEHSYSLANEKAVDMTIKKEQEKDSDSEVYGTTVNPNNMTLTIKTEDTMDTAASQVMSSHQQTGSKCSYILTSPSSSCSSVSSSRNLLTTCLPSHTHTHPPSSSSSTYIKREPTDCPDTSPPPTMVTVTRTLNPQTLLKPTIILATQPAPHTTTSSHSLVGQERLVLPKVSVKVDSPHSSGSSSHSAGMSSPDHMISYDQLSLPPTPPSSNSSDSEGCQSPERSMPSSPVRGGGMLPHSSHHHHHQHSPRPHSPGLTSPFFMNPIPTSGVLLLSEEEKRTLISEGYPIPAKLPLTKGEEKNLKKIRRKIKNKISAQESRRKKKEYLESLERKVESYSQENVDLKKKVDTLENNNRSLMSQLQKLQSIVGKLRPQNASQTSTCLMVLVLCFAVFLGTWSPMSWSIGYSSGGGNATPGSLGSLSDHHHFGAAPPPSLEHLLAQIDAGEEGEGYTGGGSDSQHCTSKTSSGYGGVMEPQVKEATTDPYTTRNLKSRVLLSVREEEETYSYYSPPRSFCLKDYISQWFHTAPAPQEDQDSTAPQEDDTTDYKPPVPKVEVLDVELEHNQTGEGRSKGAAGDNRGPEDQASMHPDISVMAQTRKQMDTAA